MKVELVFDRECPHVEAARSSLRAALARTGLPLRWSEWERAAEQTPEQLRGFGSPAVVVNGVDVTGAPPSGSACCRLYRAADGRIIGAPSPELIGAAIQKAGRREIKSSAWHRPISAVAAAGISLLPNLTCPGCWPAYAGLLSSVGLGALASRAYLLPVTAAFLAAALFSLGYRAGKRRGFGPLFLGLAASAC